MLPFWTLTLPEMPGGTVALAPLTMLTGLAGLQAKSGNGGDAYTGGGVNRRAGPDRGVSALAFSVL